MRICIGIDYVEYVYMSANGLYYGILYIIYLYNDSVFIYSCMI